MGIRQRLQKSGDHGQLANSSKNTGSLMGSPRPLPQLPTFDHEGYRAERDQQAATDKQAKYAKRAQGDANLRSDAAYSKEKQAKYDVQRKNKIAGSYKNDLDRHISEGRVAGRYPD